MAIARNEASPLFADSALGTLRLTFYLTVAIVLMIADHRGGYLGHVRALLSAAIEPVYRVAALPARLGQDARLALADRNELAERNAELGRRLMLAEATLNRYAAVEEQNQRLKRLLEVQQSLGLGAQLARLIEVDPGPFHRRIVLNVGSADNVAVGQAVIDAGGVMGQIVETLPHTSTVMLITNPTQAIPVAIERTGLRTIARGGSSADTLELPTIPISADVKAGDRIITSGLGGVYPAGFPVGEIRTISTDASGLFAAAVATPSASLDRSGEVLVLHEIPDLMGPPELAPPYGPPLSAPAEVATTEKAPAKAEKP
jgi:rod shape-determining protein MreC